jgi:LacI family transcriptional regulator
MLGNQSKPTFQDIAELAGVSTSSVSRVLNNVQPISVELKQKVIAAAKAVGYTNSRRARGADDPGSVAILVPDGGNPFFTELVKGMQDQAMRYGFILSTVVVEQNRDYVRRLIDFLISSNCAGLIVCSSCEGIQDEDLARLQEALGTPIVQIDGRYQIPDIASIEVDYVKAMQSAVRHLFELGHRRFAYLGNMGAISQRKLEGISNALSTEGIAIDEELCISGLPTIEWGFHGTNTLLDVLAEKRFTAILAHNDLSAIGALHAIRQRGLSVPNDLSLVGFDDIAMASHTNPPLTTISTPKYQMGALAMQMLVQKREHAPVSIGPFTIMESPLVIRESTGPAKGS